MKAQDKIVKGFIIGMMATSAVTHSAYGVEGVGAGFRPKITLKEDVDTAANRVGQETNPVVLAQKANIISSEIRSLKMPLSDGTIEALSLLLTRNKPAFGALRTILQGNAANVSSINQLRLEIMTLIPDVDASDKDLRQKAQSDLKAQRKLDVAQLVLNLNPRGVSANTRANMEFFLKQIKTLLEAKTPAENVLELAAEATLAEKGFRVDYESIAAAVADSDGVAAIFKGIDEQKVYEVGTINGQGLNVRMTAQQLNDLEAEVQERVQDLVDLAKNPATIEQQFAERALGSLHTANADLDSFMKDNAILDSKTPSVKAPKVKAVKKDAKNNKVLEESQEATDDAKDEAKELAVSIDGLLRELQVLGVEIGGKSFTNGFQDILRSLPLIGRLAPDRVERLKTAREKIQAIEKALVAGADKLETNNRSLLKMKSQANARMVTLRTEMARTKMAVDFLKQYAEHYESMGDQVTADAIRQQVMLRMERELNASLVFYGEMQIAISTINALVASNEIVITNANDIRRVGIPAIAIQETLRIANAQTANVIEQQRRVQAYLSVMTTQNVELLRQNADLLKEAMSTPIIEAKVIGKAISDLLEISQRLKTDAAEAAIKMGEANNEMIGVVNQIGEINTDAVGAAVRGVFKSTKQ